MCRTGHLRRPLWLTENQRAIAEQGGCPHVDPTAPTLTYADVFPGRVNPLDDPVRLRAMLTVRAASPRPFLTLSQEAA